MRAQPRSLVPVLVVASGLLACLAGLVAYRLWRDIPWGGLVDQLALLLLSSAPAFALRRLRGISWASAWACAWLVPLLVFAGVLPVIAVILLALTALALGSLCLPREGAPSLMLACGLVIIAGIDGWLLLLPLHRWYLLWPLFAGLCMWRRRPLLSALGRMRLGWRDAVAATPRVSAFAAALCCVATIAAWLPTMLADDVGYHLGLPTQLLRHGRYEPDLHHQIWALAPWLGDTLQGIVEVLAGGEARGSLNLLWLLAGAALLWQLVARQAGARMGWLAVALLASLPLTAGLMGSMQTELPAMALLLALALAILEPRSSALLIGVLAAGLVALKFSQAVAALVMLAWACVHRGRPQWRSFLPALTVFLLLAGSSYAHAAWFSGNPMFPLFNNVFHSPFMDARQLNDLRWHAGAGWNLPWRLTFEARAYFEGWEGAFGFALIALAGPWLLALGNARTRGLAVAASLILLLPLLPMQYARYAYPGMVLLLAVMVPATLGALGELRAARMLVLVCVLDFLFLANASWLLHVKAVRTLIVRKGDVAGVFELHMPERGLIAWLRAQDASDSIVLALDPATPAVAELAERGRGVSWYAPMLERARIDADGDASGERWAQLVRGIGARWLLVRPERLTAPQRQGLVVLGASKRMSLGVAQLWWVPPEPVR